jgi:tripartite-type tricarboxylate transporter receptor subunit TctC
MPNSQATPPHLALSRRHLLGMLPALPFAARAQGSDFASRPTRVLVGIPAGGTQDVLTRALAQAVRGTLGPWVLENKAGRPGALRSRP